MIMRMKPDGTGRNLGEIRVPGRGAGFGTKFRSMPLFWR
jgi:hypothetical protein